MYTLGRAYGIHYTGRKLRVPLASYESHLDAWNSAVNNPNVNFSVILNPCSGPCMSSLPEQVYITEIPNLKRYPNVKTLGYVATNYTDKSLDSVIAEIHQYALWPTLMNESRMAVDGIFFDETPGLYHWQKHDYLKAAADEVRKSEGLGQKLVGMLFLILLSNHSKIEHLQCITLVPSRMQHGTISTSPTSPLSSKTRSQISSTQQDSAPSKTSIP